MTVNASGSLHCAQRGKERDGQRKSGREKDKGGGSFQLQLAEWVRLMCETVNLVGLPLFQLKERVNRKSEKAGL